MKKLRKLLVIGVMVLSVLAMSFPFGATVKAAASTGDLIKMSGNSSVYYLGSDGKRYVFPNSTTYFSWYPDFSGVVTIPASELQSYPIGGNVTMRPGTKLVKITTDPSVYAVEPNGTLRKIQSEAQASALYGTNWNKRVVDVPDAFFTNYTMGSALTTGSVPAGSLVKNAGSSNVYYYDGTNYRLIQNDAAFAANKFQTANVLTLTSTITAGGNSITSAEFVNVAQKGATGNVITGSGLMVSLNSNTAASTNVVTTTTGGQSIADMATFNFTAANDGAVTVKTLKLKRIGVSSDSTVNNVYLYEGNTKLTDAGSLSNGYVTFSNNNGLFTVAAGQTKSISVKADIAANATGNIGFSVNAASDIVSTGASVTGSFPLNGNTMSVVTATDLATVAAGAVTSSGNVNAGTMNTTLWSAPLTVSNKAVNLKYVSFRQIGSAPADAIQNLKLYVDGTQVGSTSSINSDSRVNFDLSSAPASLGTGNRTVELRGDIVKGANTNFSFSVQTASDIVLVDTNYNVNVAASGLPKTTTTANINNGNFVIAADPTFASTQVVKGASNVTLAKYTMKAFGENMKVTTLNAVVLFNNNVANNDGINNLAIYVNGSQVGSSQNAVASGTVASFTATKTYGTTNLFTVPAGTTATVEIKGDLVMNSGSTTATTVTTNLQAVASAYQGVTSFATSPAGPAATNYATKALTIVSTGLSTLSKNNAFATAQTIAPNVQKQKIGSFTFQAGSSEAVRATNLAVTLAVAAGNITINDVSNLYTSEDPNNVIGNPVATPSVNNFPVNFTLQPGQTKTIDVFADVAQVNNNSTLQVSDLKVSARTVNTNLVADANIAGQTLTFQTGTLADPVLVSTDAPAKLVIGGTADTAAVYKFVATNGAAKITSMKVKVTNNAGTAEGTSVNSLSIGNVTAPVVYDGADYVAFFDGTLNIDVPVSTVGTNVTVTANYNTVGTNAATTRTQSKLTVTYVKYQIGSNTPAEKAGLSVAGNTMLLVAAKPTVALSATVPTNRTLSVGTQEVLRFSVTASNGPVNFKQFTVTPLFNGAGTVAVAGVYDINDMGTNLISAPVALTTNTKAAIALTNDSLISAGQTKTYVVKVSVGTLGALNSNNLALNLTSDDALGSGTDWQWNDTTVGTYGNGYLVKDLPVNGYSFNY